MKWSNSDSEGSEKFDDKNNAFTGLIDKKKNPNYGRFTKDEEDPEEEERKLKTPYEKAQDYITTAKNDVDKVQTNDFEEYVQYYKNITKNYEKSKKDYDETLKNIFIRILYKIEEKANAIDKDKQKEFPKARSTALNELKKLIKKNEKVYGDEVKKYRENKPVEDEDIKDEEVKKDDDDGDKSDISENFDQKSVSDVSFNLKDDTEDPSVRRLKWVKKIKPEKDKDKDKNKEKPVKTNKGQGKKVQQEVEVETVKELSDAVIEKECTELSNQRGQTEKIDDIKNRVSFLLLSTNNKSIKIKLLNLYVHVCFDSSKGQFFALNISTWQKISESILQLVTLYLELREDESYNSEDEAMVIFY